MSELILPPILMSEPMIAWLIASDSLLQKLGKAYFRQYGNHVTEDKATPNLRRSVHAYAPVFPIQQARGTLQESPSGAKSLDLPLFALIGKVCDTPMIVKMPMVNATDDDNQGFLVLFSSHKAALDWLASSEDGELTEEHEIESFGPVELGEMIDAAQRWTKTVWFDPGSPQGEPMDLAVFAVGLQRMHERIMRVFAGGFGDQIVQWHEVSGRRICTVLGSDGRYGALIPPDGTVYFGQTRDEALEAIKAAEL